MKKLLWLIFIVVVAGAIAAYMDPEFRHWLLQTTGTQPAATRLYKWQDSQGQWQITNTPPPAGTPYTEQEYLHDTNVIPALKPDEQK